ncbi:hypothetical protein [Desulfobaculum sp.]
MQNGKKSSQSEFSRSSSLVAKPLLVLAFCVLPSGTLFADYENQNHCKSIQEE